MDTLGPAITVHVYTVYSSCVFSFIIKDSLSQISLHTGMVTGTNH